MKTSIEDFKTGWYGVSLGLREAELDDFIQNLQGLRSHGSGHFHARSTFAADGGIADIEFYLVAEECRDDMILDYSKPIAPVQ